MSIILCIQYIYNMSYIDIINGLWTNLSFPFLVFLLKLLLLVIFKPLEIVQYIITYFIFTFLIDNVIIIGIHIDPTYTHNNHS